MAQNRIGGRPEAPIADDGDGQAMPGRHLLNFRFDRASVTINEDLNGQAALPRSSLFAGL
jgi:hypothetical protein